MRVQLGPGMAHDRSRKVRDSVPITIYRSRWIGTHREPPEEVRITKPRSSTAGLPAVVAAALVAQTIPAHPYLRLLPPDDGAGILVGQHGQDAFQPALVDLIERVWNRAVHVEDRDEVPARIEDGHHALRGRGRVAGDVTGKRVHVRHDDGFPPPRRGSAHAPAELAPQAAERALVRAHQEPV